jgi:hypothetical protein
MKIKLALVALTILNLLPGTVSAQSPTRTVFLLGSQPRSEFEKQVAAAFEARISATTRYTFGTQLNGELEVSLVCIDISMVTKGMHGGICSYHFIYWPKGIAGLSRALGVPMIMSNSEPSIIGEDIFEELVKVSTEKELAEHLSSMKQAIALYESNKNSSKP